MTVRFLLTAMVLAGLTTTSQSAPKYPFPRNGTYAYGTQAGGTTSLGTAIVSETGNEIQTAFNYWKASQLDSSGIYMRVKFDIPTVTVSEGIGYGMMIMVYMDNETNNTQAQFNKLWNYYKANLDTSGMMNWRIVEYTFKQGYCSETGCNAATDADLDVALALLLAYKQWGNANYLTEAKKLIKTIRTHALNGNHLKPGDIWDPYKNPSYVSLAALKLFQEVDSANAATWGSVIDGDMAMVDVNTAASPAGLPSDWCAPSGTPVGGKSSLKFGYDAARTPWRMSLGYAWYGTPLAKTINQRMLEWIQGEPISGIPANVKDGYDLDGNATGKYNVATYVGAMGSAGMVDDTYQDWLNASYSRLRSGADGGGYYHGSLKLLYMLTMSGNFNNMWDSAAMATTSIPTGHKPLAGATFRQQGDLLAIEAGSTRNLNAELFDLKGRSLRKSSSPGSRLEISLHGLPHGLYAVRLQHGFHQQVQRVMLTAN